MRNSNSSKMSKNLCRLGLFFLINKRCSPINGILHSSSIFRRKFGAEHKKIGKIMSFSTCQSATMGSHPIVIDPKQHWNELCGRLGLSEPVAESVWQVIEARYGEEQRSYHNIHHIRALLRHSATYADQISDKLAVDLAIYFHDIVYDPKSKTNEEASAELFVQLCSSYLNLTLCEKVRQYIIETKKHDVSHSEDNDLKLFIDMDMSILGVNPAQYEIYARQIRQEYAFVPEVDYCNGRAAVLESFLQPTSTTDTTESDNKHANETAAVSEKQTTKYIYATELFRALWEDQARQNLAWECNILKSGRLV